MALVGKIRWIKKDIFNTLREMAQKYDEAHLQCEEPTLL